LLLISAVAMALQCAAAQSQGYPNKPIVVIQPYSAGVSLDTLARIITGRMKDRLGWSFILDNRPGADGVIAIQAVMKAPADGHTLLASISSMAVLPTSKKGQLPYDPFKDFIPLTRTIDLQSMLSANMSVPANTLAELVAYSKANPGKLNYATAARGSWNQLLGELLKRETGLIMTNVPYKPGPQMEVDVMNGSVQLVVVSAPSVIQHIQAGKMKPIVVLSDRRFAGLPNVPAMGETVSALANSDVNPWGGMMVRAGTPPDIVARLHAEIVAVLRLPEMQKQILDLGGAPIIDDTLERAYKKYTSDITRWEKVVRETGVTFD
jgi:tripartite-type tricarboxylate transporter receptor subunit TctC